MVVLYFSSLYTCSMLIHELSKRTGVSSHTIRFYEKSGLIKGARKEHIKSNKYLHYTEETVEKLELIRDAKSIGFTLSEIAQLIDAWYSNTITLAEKLAILDTQLVNIDNRIKLLKDMKKLVVNFRKDVETNSC